MGIPRKGSRTLNVNGKPYRYLVKQTTIPDHADQKELSVTVQEDVEKPGNVLNFRAPFGHPVTPEYVREIVQEAFSKGWVPSARGAAFQLKEEA